ncbi:TatD family hydrolase [Ferrimonas senticii]|uniref:TatD family hydrolase n=1 Tax=Ferrimonas senticii TaxID=394566 RepID=UPI00146EEAF1|nr:TatD family hydrolase [Ferrimonas senticii]
MTVLIDSHCHLDLTPLAEDLDAVLARAQAAGVGQMLIPAIDRAHWQGLEQLSVRPELQVAIGLHPVFEHDVNADIEALSARLEQPHPFIAIGECGLDKVAGRLPLTAQIELFNAQLLLANQHCLPIILHVRQAHNELLQQLKANPPLAGGIVHGFSGGIELAKQYRRFGILIGIGGVCTYPRAAKTRKMVAELPLDGFVLETDSPDMPLSGFQGQPNQPAQLPLVVAEVASLQQRSLEQVIAAQQQNWQRLFPHWGL